MKNLLAILVLALAPTLCQASDLSQPLTKLTPVGAHTGFSENNKSADGIWINTAPALYHHAVVKIVSNRHAGSGCIVKTEGRGTWVITNWHVVEEGGQVNLSPTVVTSKGPFQAETVYHSSDLDLAILYAAGVDGLTSIPLADEMPATGSEVELCGFGGPENNLRHVSAKIRPSQFFSFEIDCPCVSGDSGGPIIALSKDGQPAIVGMNFGGPGIRGNVRAINGTDWHLVYPASSRSTGPVLVQVLTDICGRRGCWPVVFPRLRSVIGGTRPSLSPQAPPSQCGPSGCPPIRRSPCGPSTCPPRQPSPCGPSGCQPKPQAPELNPPANVPPPRDGRDGVDGKDGRDGKDGEVTQEHLDAITQAILKVIKEDPSFCGADGADGKDGKDGVNGKDADPVDYDRVVDEVIRRLPPFYPQWVDEDGRIIDEIPGGVRLGQTLPIRINKEVIKRALAN